MTVIYYVRLMRPPRDFSGVEFCADYKSLLPLDESINRGTPRPCICMQQDHIYTVN